MHILQSASRDITGVLFVNININLFFLNAQLAQGAGRCVFPPVSICKGLVNGCGVLSRAGEKRSPELPSGQVCGTRSWAGCFKQATCTAQTVGACLRPQPTYTQQTSQELLSLPASEGRGHGAGSIPRVPSQGQGCSRHEAEGPGPGTGCDSS